MKFDTPAGTNPIDAEKVVGQPHPRIDGPRKVSGQATYAYEWHDAVPETPAYGVVVGAGIATGTVAAMDLEAARRSPGVLAIVTADNAGPLQRVKRNAAPLLGGPAVSHYHQALAVVVAETFEQARAAAGKVRVRYTPQRGRFDLAAASRQESSLKTPEPDARVGDFEKAFHDAEVTLDATYHTPDQSHAMMEPHATLAAWNGDQLTVWTSNQMIDWGRTDLARTLGIAKENVRLVSPYIGGGFGGKLFLRSDALLAALAARAAKRPVKVALQRPLVANNTTHRPATLQRIRLGATAQGTLTAIGHESWSGNLPGGSPEEAVQQTRFLYAGAHRLAAMRLATLDLPEGNAMRAPGETPGLMALEIAMDELAEKLRIDPVELRIRNDTQVDPSDPSRPFSQRQLVQCLQSGADRFGWQKRSAQPASSRDGRWLVGMGMAAGFRNNLVMKSGARVRLAGDGRVTVETDMTDIGTGSYTIIGQTAAEMLGVPLRQVTVRLGDSRFPVAAGSGGQWGANSSTAGVYAACMALRAKVATALEMDPSTARFEAGQVMDGGRRRRLAEAAAQGELVAEDSIEFAELQEKYQQSTFAAHFVEVGVDVATGETRIRRMLAVCAAGRILNPTTARSQVIGAMTMGIGAALSEELVIDPRLGFFVNHDLAGYEVPVHADVPHQEVVFLDEADAISSPMKAKGVGELGLCGVSAAIANAVYNATGVRVRNYPLTLDKLLRGLPTIA
ncbi:TPA: xanthine dehydrogenase family protein molybdopterin-binding subunit [Stenotrophomonas maltophilia]|nr:xanthine dehydrogenase family protein molybdopterin-binding subunit [Stenotrophomonas maltophilia]HDS0951631.1 xanthine dehydrogenase family protein molybdopterin-binding subunit [Stenotrophomonas maltophilia]HDS1024155.1 xanthine dehydrogenase family protein molybdopterin-binding subunit [Stenotrophomonas maltophilia]HDS1028109.1 xanthine dehydrogenase family protein molybdopterin-binding subunit [Stenotrophomonas maltophilia]HDS1028350.1 xanthine dehydrogenase family protein molybdopterin-